MQVKNTKKNTKILYTIGEVKELLGVHIETLRRWDQLGKLKAIRINPNSMRRYKKSDIDDIVDRVDKIE